MKVITRPQFATVRYKVMDRAVVLENHLGEVENFKLDKEKLKSKIDVTKVIISEKQLRISDADVLIVRVEE